MSEEANLNTDVPLRWGISSTGVIARAFAASLARVPDATLLGVGSRTPERARAFADEVGAPRSYGSLPDLLADPDIDVVYIASPHTQHCRDALQAVEAGKHVLVEKPFGVSADEARVVFDAARRTGVFVMEAMWSRFLPAHVRLRELVASGVIGDVTAVSASFGFPFPHDPAHRLLDPAKGGGALLDLGVYSINTATQLLGAPREVQALATIGPTGVDVNTAVLMRFADGAVATATCSLVGADPCTATVVGTAGAIHVPTMQHSPEYLVVQTRDEQARGESGERIDLPVGGDGWRYQVHEVHACVRAGLQESAIMSWDHTLQNLEVIDRARACIVGDRR